MLKSLISVAVKKDHPMRINTGYLFRVYYSTGLCHLHRDSKSGREVGKPYNKKKRLGVEEPSGTP